MSKADIVITPERRMTFARFLHRLADHEASRAEWRDAIVEHYQDKLLESVRRECVRVLYEEPDKLRPASAQQRQIRAWAEALRVSASSNSAG